MKFSAPLPREISALQAALIVSKIAQFFEALKTVVTPLRAGVTEWRQFSEPRRAYSEAAMIFICLRNGESLELEAATKAEKRNGLLVFVDASGQTVQTLDPQGVEAYTGDPDIIEAMKEEIAGEAAPTKNPGR